MTQRSFCLLYVFVFFANVRVEDAHSWYQSTGMSLLQDTLPGISSKYPSLLGGSLRTAEAPRWWKCLWGVQVLQTYPEGPSDTLLETLRATSKVLEIRRSSVRHFRSQLCLFDSTVGVLSLRYRREHGDADHVIASGLETYSFEHRNQLMLELCF